VSYGRNSVTEDPAALDALRDELRAAGEDGRLAVLSRWMERHGGHAPDNELERVAQVIAVYAATAGASYAYRNPTPLDVPIALFVADQGKPEGGFGPAVLPGRWRPFAGAGLIVRVVPGVHAQLVLEPAATPLARALREVMDQVRRG
jgi:thioesterase domain-containing protein